MRRVVIQEGEDLVVFYYFSASEIWPDKKVGVALLDGTTVFQFISCISLFLKIFVPKPENLKFKENRNFCVIFFRI